MNANPWLLLRQVLCLGVIALGVGACSPALAQTYIVTDLGSLSGGSSSLAHGINSFGQVIGTSDDGETYTLKGCQWDCTDFSCTQLKWTCNDYVRAKQRAFLWTPSVTGGTSGTMIDLGTLNGPNATPLSLSQFGHVVGFANTSHIRTYGGRDVGSSYQFYESQAFLWTPQAPNADQGSMAGIDFFPASVNSFGQIVGGNLLWEKGATAELGPINARSINDLAQVVGVSLTPSNNQSHALLWQGGVISDLGFLAGYTNSDAYGLNTNGQIIGVAYNEGGSMLHGFVFGIDSSGTVTSRTELSPLPGAYSMKPSSINSRGEVVGTALYLSGDSRAFLWDPAHGTRDLNSLVRLDAGLEVVQAWGINDRGQIAASLGDQLYRIPYRALLLTPLPAPRLALAATQPNGQFRFTLVGEAGCSYTIQASSNLVSWIALTNFVSATGTNQFTDATASNFSGRFYRAVTP